ncbi:MAG TPA: drug/metabolite exporter YedA [Methylophilus sp.]|uniref:drug/metabolite exporter YedA n=1 Tax=Methylophilus sp. TaxID=29541 RepID=UPI002CC5E484|nr:drug/metabolite exporter YedA [Methylophilus sp.]HSH88239.1 drug/metabolite exporter YedA [Methylophilus sp.]
MSSRQKWLLIISALTCTYLIWGSTYLAIKYAIESFPPFIMVGVRFTVAGSLLYAILRGMGHAAPSITQWRGAALVGLLLPVLGNGTVSFVQLHVSSSVAALAIATAPIWMAIFSSLWGHKISRREWLGIAIGLVGILLLNTRGSLHGDWLSALLLTFAAASWSLGSVWSKHMAMPQGLIGAASQMLCGGLIAFVFSFAFGEQWPAQVSTRSWAAIAFMIVLGSIVAFSAYHWLLHNVRPMVASSNTFVNPVVAFVVGIWFADEQIHTMEYIALAVILVGVFLVLTSTTNEAVPEEQIV